MTQTPPMLFLLLLATLALCQCVGGVFTGFTYPCHGCVWTSPFGHRKGSSTTYEGIVVLFIITFYFHFIILLFFNLKFDRMVAAVVASRNRCGQRLAKSKRHVDHRNGARLCVSLKFYTAVSSFVLVIYFFYFLFLFVLLF